MQRSQGCTSTPVGSLGSVLVCIGGHRVEAGGQRATSQCPHSARGRVGNTGVAPKSKAAALGPALAARPI